MSERNYAEMVSDPCLRSSTALNKSSLLKPAELAKISLSDSRLRLFFTSYSNTRAKDHSASYLKRKVDGLVRLSRGFLLTVEVDHPRGSSRRGG